jgi:hypothetical protein
MPEPMVSATAFSKAAGVTQSAISQAIKQGRVQAYNKSGRRVSGGSPGPKFLKLEEARQSFDESRLRVDDSFLAKESEKSERGGPPRRDLVTARTRTASLQAALLQMRLAREVGDVIPKEAATAAVESLGRAVGRALKGGPAWAEEITAAAITGGGLPAVSGLLRAKFAELANSIADLITAEAKVCADPERGETGAL